MRTEAEIKTIDARQIQRAHDILVEVVTGQALATYSPEMRDLHSALDALCWVLGHEHNATFAGNLALVEGLIKDAGYELIDTGKLQVRSGDEPA